MRCNSFRVHCSWACLMYVHSTVVFWILLVSISLQRCGVYYILYTIYILHYASGVNFSRWSSTCCDCTGPLQSDSLCCSGCTCGLSRVGLSLAALPLCSSFLHSLLSFAVFPFEGTVKLLPHILQLTELLVGRLPIADLF